MAWFSVTSTARAPNGTNVVFAFETEDANDLNEFADALAEGEPLVGRRFRVRNPRSDVRGVLDDPRDFLITREGVAFVTPFGNLSEYDIAD